MAVHSAELRFSTEGDGDVVDLTDGLRSVVRQSGVREGLVSVFVPGATAAVTAIEFEPGGVADLRAALERLIPREGDYEHNRLNADTNSHAHMRAAIVGPSETVPVANGRAGDRHLAADRARRLRRPPQGAARGGAGGRLTRRLTTARLRTPYAVWVFS